ncbi:Abortive infection bacteriophage resistance protein [uncultured Eubacterium sp.]|uniref:Abi family protein n=1 Tax=Brotomerdimonas butyrica TaxID=2981721 RepID=UPI0008222044|nr:Abi family protein [Brotomerdimonas butyrica]MCU6755305.1 Abi family protein [Brotomerdimonas butyrica]SCH22149.1 Abortive infection bacteriophage resistance protein [uncultured Eubacterium sp.]
MSYKTTDALMRHLRDNGIAISGSRHKRELINTGYFHGYKGYRFFKNASNQLPFQNYDEVYATIQYDSKLKSLLYSKMMFIETAVKNIALEEILINANSESIQVMYDKVVSSYRNAPASASLEQKKKLQQNKLNLQNSIQASLANAYRKNNPKITHFYNNASQAGVPIWALFEIMTLGDFGYLLSCLTYDVRDDISKRLGLNVSADTDRQLIYKYIYTLKDLRNAIAHNSVVFDTRFNNNEPTRAMKTCLKNEIGLPYVNFKTIGDYIILMCYYLKLLKVSKTEIKAFIREFEKITDEYRVSVNTAVVTMVIHPDLSSRIQALKNYV